MSKNKQTPSAEVDQKKLLNDRVEALRKVILKMTKFEELLQMEHKGNRKKTGVAQAALFF